MTEAKFGNIFLDFLFYLFKTTAISKPSNFIITRQIIDEQFRKARKLGFFPNLSYVDELLSLQLNRGFLRGPSKHSKSYTLSFEANILFAYYGPVYLKSDFYQKITMKSGNQKVKENLDNKHCDDDQLCETDLLFLFCYLKLRNLISNDRMVFKFFLINRILKFQKMGYLKGINLKNSSFPKMINKFTTENLFDKFVFSEKTMTLIDEGQSEFKNSTFYQYVIDDNETQIDSSSELEEYEYDNILDFFIILNDSNKIDRKTRIVSRGDLVKFVQFFNENNRFHYINIDLLREYLINCGFIDASTPKRGDTYVLNKKIFGVIKSIDINIIPTTAVNGLTKKCGKKNQNVWDSEPSSDGHESNYIKDYLYYLFVEKKIPNNCRLLKIQQLEQELRHLKVIHLKELIDYTDTLYLIPTFHNDVVLLTSKLLDDFKYYEKNYYRSQFYRTLMMDKQKKKRKVMNRTTLAKKCDHVLLFLWYLTQRRFFNESDRKVNKFLMVNELIKLQSDNYLTAVDLDNVDLEKILINNSWCENYKHEKCDPIHFAITSVAIEAMKLIDLKSTENVNFYLRCLREKQDSIDTSSYVRDNIIYFLCCVTRYGYNNGDHIRKSVILKELAILQNNFRFTYINPDYLHSYLHNCTFMLYSESMDSFIIDQDFLKDINLYRQQYQMIFYDEIAKNCMMSMFMTFWNAFKQYLFEKGMFMGEPEMISKVHLINEIIKFQRSGFFLNINLQKGNLRTQLEPFLKPETVKHFDKFIFKPEMNSFFSSIYQKFVAVLPKIWTNKNDENDNSLIDRTATNHIFNFFQRLKSDGYINKSRLSKNDTIERLKISQKHSQYTDMDPNYLQQLFENCGFCEIGSTKCDHFIITDNLNNAVKAWIEEDIDNRQCDGMMDFLYYLKQTKLIKAEDSSIQRLVLDGELKTLQKYGLLNDYNTEMILDILSSQKRIVKSNQNIIWLNIFGLKEHKDIFENSQINKIYMQDDDFLMFLYYMKIRGFIHENRRVERIIVETELARLKNKFNLMRRFECENLSNILKSFKIVEVMGMLEIPKTLFTSISKNANKFHKTNIYAKWQQIIDYEKSMEIVLWDNCLLKFIIKQIEKNVISTKVWISKHEFQKNFDLFLDQLRKDPLFIEDCEMKLIELNYIRISDNQDHWKLTGFFVKRMSELKKCERMLNSEDEFISDDEEVLSANEEFIINKSEVEEQRLKIWRDICNYEEIYPDVIAPMVTESAIPVENRENNFIDFLFYLKQINLLSEKGKISKFLLIDYLRAVQTLPLLTYIIVGNAFKEIMSQLAVNTLDEFDQFIFSDSFMNELAEYADEFRISNLSKSLNEHGILDIYSASEKTLFTTMAYRESILDLFSYIFEKSNENMAEIVRSKLISIIETLQDEELFLYISIEHLDMNLYCSDIIDAIPDDDIYVLTSRFISSLKNRKMFYGDVENCESSDDEHNKSNSEVPLSGSDEFDYESESSGAEFPSTNDEIRNISPKTIDLSSSFDLMSSEDDDDDFDEGDTNRDDFFYDFLYYLMSKKCINPENQTIGMDRISNEFLKLKKFQCLEHFDGARITEYLFGLQWPRVVLRTNIPRVLRVTHEACTILSNYGKFYKLSKISDVEFNCLRFNTIVENNTATKDNIFIACSNKQFDNFYDFLYYLKLNNLIPENRRMKLLTIEKEFAAMKENELLPHYRLDQLLQYLWIPSHAFSIDYDEIEFTVNGLQLIDLYGKEAYEYSAIRYSQSRPMNVRQENRRNSGYITNGNYNDFEQISSLRELHKNYAAVNKPVASMNGSNDSLTRPINTVVQNLSQDSDNFFTSFENLSRFDSIEHLGTVADGQNDIEFVEKSLIIQHQVTYRRKVNPFTISNGKGCIICRLNFMDEIEFKRHIGQHNANPANMSGINRYPEVPVVQFNLKCNLIPDSPNVDFCLMNQTGRKTIQQVVMLTPHNQVMTFQKNLWPKSINNGECVMIVQPRELFSRAPYEYTIVIHFIYDSSDYIELHSLILGEKFPNPIDFTISIDDRLINKQVELRKRNRGKLIDQIFKSDEKLEMSPLDQFAPNPLMRSLFDKKFKRRNKVREPLTENETLLFDLLVKFDQKPKFDRLTAKNYVNMLQRLIQIEDIFCEYMMFEYDKQNQTFHSRTGFELKKNMKTYALMVENLSEHRPSLLPFDKVIIYTEPSKYSSEYNQFDSFEGLIVKVEKDFILVTFKIAIDILKTYHVHFEMNRVSFRQSHNALKIIKELELTRFFFPETAPDRIPDRNSELKWVNKNIETNPEQKQAVTNIVLGLAHPLPYIIFGPPGTGKTMVIVEAIAQLYFSSPSSRVLVTAGSNSACDEITSRLLQYIPHKDMFRMFAASLSQVIYQIDDSILDVSNLAMGKHFFPHFDSIKNFRVVLCTITVAGKLVRANINPRHFTHLFIDECASVTETLGIVPIAGMITSAKKLHGNIILAGDPLQLGPINHSTDANKLGLGISMLERLMNLPVYQKNTKTGKYNANIITKLLRNYRSHQTILKVPNKMFYDGELLPMAHKENVNWALKWTELPNPNIPIIFRAVSGLMRQEINSPSYFNTEEIEIVKKYLKLMMNKTINDKRFIDQADIGIISPYIKQCKKIKDYCEKRCWNNIEVASVEAFQGREKSIIIISTVRSNTTNMGFLSNPRRLNVALTRAKGLLIIVGDPKLLHKDPHWRQFIKYCIDNQCMVGERFELTPRK